MCNDYLTKLGKLDLPRGHLQKVLNYHWKDRPNKRDYYVKVTENGRLLSFTCCDEHGLVLHDLDFTELDCAQNLWYLPTSKHPVILNQNNNIFYELGVPRLRQKVSEDNEPEVETKLRKEKIIWYEFFDEHNQRIYEVGFHLDGDLVGYKSYGSTKDDILHELVSSEDSSNYCYEDMKMVGKFELIKVQDIASDHDTCEEIEERIGHDEKE